MIVTFLSSRYLSLLAVLSTSGKAVSEKKIDS